MRKDCSQQANVYKSIFAHEKPSPRTINPSSVIKKIALNLKTCTNANLMTKKRIPNTIHPSTAFIKFILQPENVQKPKLVEQKTEPPHDQPFISNNEKIAHNLKTCTNTNLMTKSRKPRRKRPNRQKFGPKNPITSEKTKDRLPQNQEKWQISRVVPAEKICRVGQAQRRPTNVLKRPFWWGGAALDPPYFLQQKLFTLNTKYRNPERSKRR